METNLLENRKAIIMAITEAGGVGPRMFQNLIMRLGAPEDMLTAPHSDFRDIPRLGDEGIAKLTESLRQVEIYEEKLKEYNEDNINVVTFLDNDYPQKLRAISDPPPVIYCKGNSDAWNSKYIALVGTTKASQEGIRFAVDLARKFVLRDFGIVSGLAIGIDSAAHLGTLKAQGRTMAVLGCGVSNIYPGENLSLAEAIEKDGLLISEHPPYKKVSRPGLVLRNRLISALSEAVIVVQVGEETSGELRTAAFAIKQAKPLFYGNCDGSLDLKRIEKHPGLEIRDTGGVDEVIKYLI